jgi:hypothetical protein
MRKVKSAPANLCEMVNNKKEAKTKIKSYRFIIPIMNIESTIILEDKNEKNKIINKPKKYETFETFKKLKTGIKRIGSLTSDVIGDSNLLPYEETTLLNVFINYISENVLKKDKLKEIYAYALQAFVRYLLMLFIHSQLLHNELGKNVPLIDNNIINEINNII